MAQAFLHGFLDTNKNLSKIGYKLNLRMDHTDLSNLPGLKNNFMNIAGQIKLEIIDFKGMLDKGKFNFGGRLALEEFAPGDFDFRFSAHNLFLDIPNTMELTFNSMLNFSETSKESKF